MSSCGRRCDPNLRERKAVSDSLTIYVISHPFLICPGSIHNSLSFRSPLLRMALGIICDLFVAQHLHHGSSRGGRGVGDGTLEGQQLKSH